MTISQSATRFVKAYSGTGRSFSVTTRRPRPARPTVEVGYAAAPPSGFQQAIPASARTPRTTSYIQRTLLACARRVYPTHAATDYDYAVGERQHSLLKSSSSSPIRRQPQAPVSNSYSGNISQIMRTRNNSNACQRLLSVADREVPYGVPSRRLVRF